jgi:HK97 family phage major capsid protein
MDFSNREQTLAFCKQMRNDALEVDFRAMGVGEVAKGEKAVPEKMVNAYYVARDATSPVRSLATVIPTKAGGPIKVPNLADTEAGVLLDENTVHSTQDVGMGETALTTYKFHSKAVVVSQELFDDAGPAILMPLGKVLGSRIGRITNRYFTVGTGVNQPTGVVTTSTLGKEAAAGNAVSYTELVDLMTSLDPAYQSNAKWMFNFETFATLMKMEDGAQRPLFNGEKLLGKPFVINQDMPSMEAESKPILYGDFETFVIREAEEVTLRKYRERFAENHQLAFATIARSDSGTLDSAGIRHLLMAEA